MKFKNIIIAALFLIISCATPTQKLYKAKPGFYSYAIGGVQNDKIDEGYALDVYVTPASCQKVVTSLVALKTLGPEFRYKTELLTKKQGDVTQDIMIKFSGDPTLSSEQLISLLKPLQNKKINGQVILDASEISVPSYSPNIVIDDIGTHYSTPISAINIDKNLILVKISPKKIGKSTAIYTVPNYKVVSNLTTNNEPSGVKLFWQDNVIHVKGSIDQEEKLLELKISPINHDQYVIGKISFVLNALNIKAKNKIKIIHNKKPNFSGFKLINTIYSERLQDFVSPALKSSNNLTFDALYLTIINANSEEEITDWAQGGVIFKDLIKKHFAIEMNNSLLIDGSGLSRYNRIQPKLMLLLLKKGFEVKEFVQALPRPGEEESTLQQRATLPNYIRAKTGNMSGISCLCGYSFKSANHPKAFVFMVNSFSPPSKDIFEVMDDFVKNQM